MHPLPASGAADARADLASRVGASSLILPALLITVAIAAVAYRDLVLLVRGPAAMTHPEVVGAERFFFVPANPSYVFVVPLFLWILFGRLRRVRACLARPDGLWPGTALVTGAVGLGAWAYYAGVPSLLVPSLALSVLGAGWLLGGRAGARELLRPVALLYFAWPWPGVLANAVVWPLQILASDLAVQILSLLGVQYTASGDQVLAHGNLFHVIETCNGMRSVETLTMTAFAYSEIFGRRGRRVWALVLAAPAIALLLNGVRVVTIILNPHSATIGVHTLQGLVMIVVGVFTLAGLDRLLDRLGWFPDSAPRRLRVLPRAPFRPLRWGLLTGLLAILALSGAWIEPATHSVANPSLMTGIPSQLGDWLAHPARMDSNFYGSVRTTSMTRRNYQKEADGATVTLFASTDDRSARASLLSPKTAIGEPSYEVESQRIVHIGDWEVERLVLRSVLHESVLALQWRRGVRPIAVETLRATLGLDQSPFGRDDPLRVLRIATAIPRSSDGEATAEAHLLEIADALAEAPFLAGAVSSPEGRERIRELILGNRP